jgi:hypothetical protein
LRVESRISTMRRNKSMVRNKKWSSNSSLIMEKRKMMTKILKSLTLSTRWRTRAKNKRIKMKMK